MAVAPTSTASNHSTYIGRFAPSPTGLLHFGSLIGALASYCDARAAQGQWLLRMEDLDPPREQLGAAEAILKTLEAHGLYWDGEVLYQSQRLDAYQTALEHLQQNALVYPCICSRKELQNIGGVYPGYCLNHPPMKNAAAAIRVKTSSSQFLIDGNNAINYDDVFFGPQHIDLCQSVGDFIIKRRDGLFAYQLAVVVDDAFQNITHVIRGSDLLSSTPMQIHLQHCLGFATPQYGHFPVASNSKGQKLSKQHHAKALNNKLANKNLFRALDFLQQQPPPELAEAPKADILSWACQYWDRRKIPAVTALVIDRDFRLHPTLV